MIRDNVWKRRFSRALAKGRGCNAYSSFEGTPESVRTLEADAFGDSARRPFAP